MRLNYILLPVLCYVKWQLFQSCVFCCNILPSSFQREIKKVFAQESCGVFILLQDRCYKGVMIFIFFLSSCW